jgi:drug/metabolite transporter (DMT)-like permease
MENTQINIARGYPIAVLSAVVLSTTAILTRILTTTYALPPLVLAFWRALFCALTLVLALGILRPQLFRVSRANLRYLLLYGLMLAIFNSLWTLSVAWNGAAVSNVLVYCSTAFTALLGWWLLKERLTPVKILAVVICLAGTVFVSQAVDPKSWQSNLLGIITGVLSGLWYAIYSLMGRSASGRGLNPWTTLFYTFSFATLFLGLFNLLPLHLPGAAANPSEILWLRNQWSGWGLLLLLAAGPTVVGFGLMNVSLSYLPSSTANLILTLEPVLTVTTATLFLGERMAAEQWFGSALIIGGVVLMRAFEGRLAATPAEP